MGGETKWNQAVTLKYSTLSLWCLFANRVRVFEEQMGDAGTRMIGSFEFEEKFRNGFHILFLDRSMNNV